MAVTCIISRAKLEGRHRIDAEYYHPRYVELADILSRSNPVAIGTIAKSLKSFGAYSLMNQVVYRESGIPFLRGVDLKEGYADFSNVVFIDASANRLLWKSAVVPGQVLLAMSGSVGNTAVARPTWPYPVNSSQDLAKITLRTGIDPYYITTFLNSKFGRFQTERLPVGSIQQHCFLWQIASIKIPLFYDLQLTISKTAEKAISSLEASKLLYTQAEQLLLTELGLQNWKPSHTLAYVRNYSQAERVRRMDAEYFHPKYDELIRHISEYRPQRLSKLATQITDVVKFDEQQEYNYIEISDVNTSNGEIGFTEREVKDLPPNAKIKVNGGELIISKVRPTRGAIGVIPNDCLGNGVCSSAFVVLDAPSPIREFLQVYLRSTIGRTLLEKPCKGTSYPTINDADIKALPIPIIPAQLQERMSVLVNQSYLARQEAKALLEKAKRAVEIAIEECEDKAMEFVKENLHQFFITKIN